MAELGHNSVDDGALRAFVERIEHVEQEQSDRAEDKKEIYQEAKGGGYDVKVLRRLVAERRKDAEKLAEEEAILDLYRSALGTF